MIKHITPDDNSEFCLLSSYFPQEDWLTDEWLNWIDALRKKKVTIRVVGGKMPDLNPTMKDLFRKKLTVRFLDSVSPTHFGIVTSPKQIWFEGYHPAGRKAYGCSFTPNPNQDAWDEMKYVFEELWNTASPFENTADGR